MDLLEVTVKLDNLVLLGPEKHAISNRIRYLVIQKSIIRYLFSHNYAKIKIDSYDSLPL